MKELPNKNEVWNIFHDGSITQIGGTLPDISITIEIPYLRHVFSDDGNSFIAKLKNCSLIEFLVWETEERFQDLDLISSLEPEILSVEEVEDKAQIFCGTGEFFLKYQDISFQLDSGKLITILDLDEASKKYWTEWERHWAGKGNKNNAK